MTGGKKQVKSVPSPAKSATSTPVESPAGRGVSSMKVGELRLDG